MSDKNVYMIWQQTFILWSILRLLVLTNFKMFKFNNTASDNGNIMMSLTFACHCYKLRIVINELTKYFYCSISVINYHIATLRWWPKNKTLNTCYFNAIFYQVWFETWSKIMIMLEKEARCGCDLVMCIVNIF